MKDDRYLWDRGGTPDPDIERLERVLAPLAHDERPLALPEPRRPTLRPRLREIPCGAGLLLAAASLAIVMGAAWWQRDARQEGWVVETVDGAPRIGSRSIEGSGRLGVGQRLVTDARSRARVAVSDIGEVTLDPNSRLRLVRATADEQRMALERGTLHAIIVAPPRRFKVDTPAATAVDLGCAYTLVVDAEGRTRVTVESGWVSFERDGRETFIPAGAQCSTSPGADPGLPYFLGADPRLAVFADAFDPGVAGPREALADVLAAARAEDALTLWHLLVRVTGERRLQVYDRLATLAPPPAGVTRDGVLASDRAMLDRWWDALGFGEAEWWRIWSQDPPAGRS